MRTTHTLKPKMLLERVAQAKVDNLDALALVEKPWNLGVLWGLGFKGLGV